VVSVLRPGKHLPNIATEIVLELKPPSQALFVEAFEKTSQPI
jgi:hypothetical protein